MADRLRRSGLRRVPADGIPTYWMNGVSETTKVGANRPAPGIAGSQGLVTRTYSCHHAVHATNPTERLEFAEPSRPCPKIVP
jgi:hypothetical protein